MIIDRPTVLRVNLDALYNNYKKLVELNKNGIAVVKANAYGLGAKVVAEHLYKKGVKYFAVATLEEALQIKKVTKDALILVLGATNPANINYAIENNISLCCPSIEWLEDVLKQLEHIDGVLKIHVKLETGMNRLGIFHKEDVIKIDKLLNNEKINFEGVFSHYANADGETDDYDKMQTEHFDSLVSLFTIRPKYIHLENSAGTIRYAKRDKNYHLTRLGIALYGAYPSPNIEKLNNIELETVATLVSGVTHVKKITKGTKVGYGNTYEAKEDEYIATVPIGYADGLLRRAQGYKVMLNGERCEIVGRICMDQLMVRCSEHTKVGDKVLFFGELDSYKLSLDDFANYQNTISYEILCCISARVPRKYYIENTEL